MATLDKVKMTFPNGDVFEARGNLQITEIQKPNYIVDGFSTIQTLIEQVPWGSNDTSQVFLGDGARMRTWNIEFDQWEGSTDEWGSANDDDDVFVKLQVLGQTLATAGIDGQSPVMLEFGEYSSGGKYSAQEVVPGEVNLPLNFGPEGSPSKFRPSLEWRDSEDVQELIHEAAP